MIPQRFPLNAYRWRDFEMKQPPSYTIEFKPESGIVRLSLLGHFDLGVLQSLKCDLDRIPRRAPQKGADTHSISIILDFRRHSLQSQDVAAQAAAFMANYDTKAHRVALLLPNSALHSMQLKRIAPTHFRIFAVEQDAVQWLTSAPGD